MDKYVKSVFTFENYIVNKLDFKLNSNFSYSKPVDIDFSVDINVTLADSPLTGRVTLDANVFNDALKENYPFELFVSMTGSFSVTDDSMTKEQFLKFCGLNGTAALFPFLRTIIADVTKAANIEPLILPLINVQNLIDNQNEEEKA
jgi:preprotein translocase subunit SecB